MVSHLLKTSTFIFCAKNLCQNLNRRFIVTSSTCKIPSTVDNAEVEKFDKSSGEWWSGESLLHSFNSVRVPLVRDGILSVSKCYKKKPNPLAGYSILDAGCGGGLLSEPLARLGAEVTGLDPGAQSIQIAQEHASKDPEISKRLTYICDTVENLTTSDKRFDAVVSSEVIEHVNDVHSFVQSCVELTKTNGSLFFTTINRTNISYVVSIILAEYVTGLIPRGTHEWNKFVQPEDLVKILESLNCRIVSIEGVAYNPFTKKFMWCKNDKNMYALHAVKM